MEKIIKISRIIVKLAQEDMLEHTSSQISKNRSKSNSYDSSEEKIKYQKTPKHKPHSYYPVENPVDHLLPGGINVY